MADTRTQLKFPRIEHDIPVAEPRNNTGLYDLLRELKKTEQIPRAEPPSFWWEETLESTRRQILLAASRLGFKVRTSIEYKDGVRGLRVHKVESQQKKKAK